LNIAVFYIGSSLLSPLKQAEQEINRAYKLGLQVAAFNFGAPLTAEEWQAVKASVSEADIVFVIHVMDGENGARLLEALEKYREQHRAVVVINCMPELMRRTRMGGLSFGGRPEKEQGIKKDEKQVKGTNSAGRRAKHLVGAVGSWMGQQARARSGQRGHNHTFYLKLVDRLPMLLRFVPGAGKLRDIKNYLLLFCYFLQPTPANIRSMLLYALKQYVPDKRLANVEVPRPETLPAVALYHPDAPALFESFAAYRRWYERRAREDGRPRLEPEKTIGLLLMRPQIVSRARKHYDRLIRAIEDEGLAVLPATSTLMDNREACEKFFIDDGRWTMDDGKTASHRQSAVDHRQSAAANGLSSIVYRPSRVSQIVSLTGFSFVGGPAMNDSRAAARFLLGLNRPFRSAVSLDMQTIESWRASGTGLNPVQAGMQVAIPELDGATERLGACPARRTLPAAGPSLETLELFADCFAKRGKARSAHLLLPAAQGQHRHCRRPRCFSERVGDAGSFESRRLPGRATGKCRLSARDAARREFRTVRGDGKRRLPYDG
jgi:magnesium chelatase subunit H